MPEDSPVDPLSEMYASRWVARVEGKVVAQGGTPDEALRAAQRTRFKEKLEIIFMHPAEELPYPPIFEKIRQLIPPEMDVFLVGGAVRDLFLHRPIHDFDFALKSDAIRLAKKIANQLNAPYFPLDLERDTGRVLLSDEIDPKTMLDFAAFRGSDLEQDLKGRDFTINALAIDLKDMSLHDPLGGLSDLRSKVLRACSPSSFSDDPVRILRAVRFAADLGLKIQPETRQAMRSSSGLLTSVTPERVRDEIFHILAGEKPAICIKALDMLGAIQPILPELSLLKGVQQPTPHVNDVWTHTLNLVHHLETILDALSFDYDPDSAQDFYHSNLVIKLGRYRQQISNHLGAMPNSERTWREILLFAGLFHDIDKPHKATTGADGRIRFWGHEQGAVEIVEARARHLALSNDEIARLVLIIKNHMRINYLTGKYIEDGRLPSRRAIYRFFRDAGQSGVETCLLSLADLRATFETTLPGKHWLACLEVVRVLLEAWWEYPEEKISPPRVVNGDDLMTELEIAPGPLLGVILEAIREEQVVGKIPDKDAAIKYAKDYMNDLSQGKVRSFAQVNQTRLAFFERPGNGPAMVLIHGYPLDHTIWQPMLPYLEKNLHLIMPDLRGHGASLVSRDPYEISTLADDLEGLLDHLKVPKAILVGHSMGGYVALAFARTHADRLLGLALVASRSLADSPEQKEGRRKSIETIQAQGIQSVVGGMPGRMTSVPEIAGDLRDLISRMQPEGVIQALQAMMNRQDTTSILAGLQIPVLVVAGVEDQLIPVTESRQMEHLSDQVEYVEMTGVGHVPMLESPQRLASSLNQLVKRVRSSLPE